jgi:hypothetical protein
MTHRSSIQLASPGQPNCAVELLNLKEVLIVLLEYAAPPRSPESLWLSVVAQIQNGILLPLGLNAKPVAFVERSSNGREVTWHLLSRKWQPPGHCRYEAIPMNQSDDIVAAILAARAQVGAQVAMHAWLDPILDSQPSPSVRQVGTIRRKPGRNPAPPSGDTTY